MSYQHKHFLDGSWNHLSFIEQMANIGSEVERALNWQIKNNIPYCRNAAIRALELLDFALDAVTNFSRRKELARVREAVVDYFFGKNEFKSSQALWKNYFSHFNYVARRNY